MDAGFTLDDFMAQMEQVKELGPMGKVMAMIPGMNDLTKKSGAGAGEVEKQMARMTAIYRSMSRRERQNTGLLDGQRRRRIARGAGLAATDVSRFIKQFEMTREMMHAVGGTGVEGRLGRASSVLGLVTEHPKRRDPSWVHRFAPRAPHSGPVVGRAIVAALVALGVAVLLYHLTR